MHEQGKLKGIIGSFFDHWYKAMVAAAIWWSHMEGSYCTSGLFWSKQPKLMLPHLYCVITAVCVHCVNIRSGKNSNTRRKKLLALPWNEKNSWGTITPLHLWWDGKMVLWVVSPCNFLGMNTDMSLLRWRQSGYSLVLLNAQCWRLQNELKSTDQFSV